MSEPYTMIAVVKPRCSVCGEHSSDPRCEFGFRAVGEAVFCGEACEQNRRTKMLAQSIMQRIGSHYMRRTGTPGENPFDVFEEEKLAIVDALRTLLSEYETLPPVRPEREATAFAKRLGE